MSKPTTTNTSQTQIRTNDVTAPNYGSLNLKQLFDACQANIALIQNTLDTEVQPPRRRLDKISTTLDTVACDFWSHGYSPDPVMYLLLLVVQRLYNSIIQYIDHEHVIISTELREGIPTSDSLLLRLVPRVQVRESLETQLAGLVVSEDERERIEGYVYKVNVRIGRASRYLFPLEKVLTVLEMWMDHLLGLAMYTYSRSSNGSTTSVKFALSGITRLLSLKELRSRSVSPETPERQSPPPRPKSESFLWQDLHSGGDGSGKVYKIRVKDYLDWDGKSYACKVLRQTRHSTSSNISTEQEAVQAISKERHPNVVEILDTWIEETQFVTTCFIMMELCLGDLAEFLQVRYHEIAIGRRGFAASDEVWGTFSQVMRGLEYIHSRGIIHRDLKPKNVLYTKDTEGNLIWKITDFGFSATSSPEPTTVVNPLTTGHMTRNYCAPEVIIGSRYDQKADIWSAGCILYELATGNPPFSTENEVREYAWSGMLFPSVASLRGKVLGSKVDRMVGGMMHVAAEMRPTAGKVIELIPRDRHRLGQNMFVSI